MSHLYKSHVKQKCSKATGLSEVVQSWDQTKLSVPTANISLGHGSYCIASDTSVEHMNLGDFNKGAAQKMMVPWCKDMKRNIYIQ